MKPYSIFLQRNGTYFLNKPRINRAAHDGPNREMDADLTHSDILFNDVINFPQ